VQGGSKFNHNQTRGGGAKCTSVGVLMASSADKKYSVKKISRISGGEKGPITYVGLRSKEPSGPIASKGGNSSRRKKGEMRVDFISCTCARSFAEEGSKTKISRIDFSSLRVSKDWQTSPGVNRKWHSFTTGKRSFGNVAKGSQQNQIAPFCLSGA